MSDMTRCKGHICPPEKRDKCLRYTKPPNWHKQYYYSSSPIEESGKCEYFIDNKK